MTLLNSGTQHGILPVGTLSEGGYLIVCIATLVAPIVLLKLCPFGGVEQVELFADAAHANIICVVYVCLLVATLTFLCGDENDTIGTT